MQNPNENQVHPAPESVELIAAGYEWLCPACDHHNWVMETSEQVICAACQQAFLVADYHHALA